MIYRIVGEGTLNYENISNELITDYYSKVAFLYRKFHSEEGAMHFPLEFSNKDSHKKKLFFQAESIHRIVNKYDYCNILELGCGMGMNTHYLAEKNPKKKFTGIDLTPGNIKFARRKSKKLDNAFFESMNFDKIQGLNEKYDLIFAVETLCYSKDLTVLINNLGNKLNDNGKVIVFDAYIKPKTTALTKDIEKRAFKLLLWGWALSSFQNLDNVQRSKKLNTLKINKVVDYSENILPNNIAYQKGSIKAFQSPFLLKVLLKTGILPLTYVKHLTAGLFFGFFVKMGFLGYYKLELTRNLPNNGYNSLL